MESTRLDVVAKLSLNDDCPPDIMHVGHRLVSDEVSNRHNARVTACNAFNDAVEEPCLCDGVGLRRQ